jgi:hypothetical protein
MESAVSSSVGKEFRNLPVEDNRLTVGLHRSIPGAELREGGLRAGCSDALQKASGVDRLALQVSRHLEDRRNIP